MSTHSSHTGFPWPVGFRARVEKCVAHSPPTGHLPLLHYPQARAIACRALRPVSGSWPAASVVPLSSPALGLVFPTWGFLSNSRETSATHLKLGCWRGSLTAYLPRPCPHCQTGQEPPAAGEAASLPPLGAGAISKKGRSGDFPRLSCPVKSLQLTLINYYCCWGLILQQAFVLESSWKDTGPLLALLLLGLVHARRSADDLCVCRLQWNKVVSLVAE